MAIKREWATPITVGAFLISAVTGVLMFFHIDISLNKLAHEWLSWLLLIGVLLHVAANFPSFKRYFSINKGRLLIGFFSLLLLLSFFPFGGDKGKPPFVQPIEILSKAPLSTLAIIAKVSPEKMLKRLTTVDVHAESEQQSIEDLVGNDFHKQVHLLNQLLQE